MKKRAVSPLRAIVDAWALACVVAASAFVGCSTSPTTTYFTTDADADGGADAGGDAPGDAGAAGDAPSDASAGGLQGVRCPNTPCGSGQTCCAIRGAGGPQFSCVSGASCGDAGFVVACDGPEDCTTDESKPLCCGTLALGSGTAPACPLQSASASCVATCNTSLAQTCPTTWTVRLCHSASECTESSYPKCCAFTQGSVTARFCVDNATSQLSASCL